MIYTSDTFKISFHQRLLRFESKCNLQDTFGISLFNYMYIYTNLCFIVRSVVSFDLSQRKNFRTKQERGVQFGLDYFSRPSVQFRGFRRPPKQYPTQLGTVQFRRQGAPHSPLNTLKLGSYWVRAPHFI